MEAPPKYGSKEHIAINRKRVDSIIECSISIFTPGYKRSKACMLAVSMLIRHHELVHNYNKKFPEGGITCPETDGGESIVKIKSPASRPARPN